MHIVPEAGERTDAVYDRIEGVAPAEPEATPAFPTEQAPRLRREVETERKAHPMLKVHLDWEGLRRMVSVHVRNGGELLQVLSAIGTDFELAMELVQNVRPPDVRDAVQAELDQRLHNYVASTSSLVDQTRRVVERYEGTWFAKEYTKRKETITGTPVVGFVRDLRNYALHRALPFLGHSLSFAGAEVENFESQVQLSTAALSAWDGWKAPAKAYLAQCGDAVDLHEAIAAHMAIYEEMWRWILDQHRGLHRTDVCGYNELIMESNWYLSAGREGRPRRAWALLPSCSGRLD
jgi:hypothetical protein